MAHLQFIGLKNFRVFDQEGYLFELAPISIFTGANNSGRSSVLKAILLLQQSFLKHSVLEKLDFSLGNHFLGDLHNVVHDRKDDELSVTLPFPLFYRDSISIELRFKGKKQQREFNPEFQGFKVTDHQSNKEVFSITPIPFERPEKLPEQYSEDYYHLVEYRFQLILDVPWFRQYMKDKVDRWGRHKEQLEERRKTRTSKWYGIVSTNEEQQIDDIYRDIMPSYSGLYAQIPNMYPVELASVDQIDGFYYSQNRDEELENLQLVLNSEYKERIDEEVLLRKEDTEPYWQYAESDDGLLTLYLDLLPVEREFGRALRREFYDAFRLLSKNLEKRVSHVPSARGGLSRMYGYSGNSFNKLLFRYTSLELHQPGWTKCFVDKWIAKFEIEDYVALEVNALPDYQLNRARLVCKEGEKKRDLLDFGYGVLQVVTLLIQIVTEAGENRADIRRAGLFLPHTTLVEEPEANLHPRWQSLLAEVFVDASRRFRTQFIIETHSEYLIRNIQGLVAKNEIPNSSLALYYINDRKRMAEGANQVERIPFGSDGSLDYTKIGSGFFDEHYNLRLSLFNINRDKFVDEFNAVKAKLAKAKDQEGRLSAIIDEFTQKQNLTGYQQEVEDLIGGAANREKISGESFEYLASAKFLYKNLEGQVDYSPIVIQCGRAVERELLDFFSVYKSRILLLTETHSSLLEESDRSVCDISAWSRRRKRIARRFIKALEGRQDLKFSQMQVGLSFLRFPEISSVEVFKTLQELLEGHVDLSLLPLELAVELIHFVRNERNKAGHTYNSFLSRAEAYAVIEKTEEFLQIWIGAKL